MKKALPYILIPLASILLAIIVINTFKNRQKVFIERITLREKDKNPYGFFIAKKLVPSLFQNADFYSDKRPPLEWDSLRPSAGNQAVIIIANQFRASQRELNDLRYFAANGNHVFIILRTMSYDARLFFDLIFGTVAGEDPRSNDNDTLAVTLTPPRFMDSKVYFYSGKKYAGHFSNPDTSKLIVLGRNGDGDANFVQYNIDSGAIYIHAAPLAFSNYFLLQPFNMQYLEKVFSVIPATVDKIVWNEYYLVKNNQREGEPNWLGVLMQYPSLRWALLIAIIAMLLFTLLESRRRQKVIPTYTKPQNDSLDFVKTIGRLYYDKKDHKNLVTKMSSFFLDHVRSKYQISTTNLDNSFVEALQAKSNFSKDKINLIIQSLNSAEAEERIDEEWMYNFHKQLEAFYQNT